MKDVKRFYNLLKPALLEFNRNNAIKLGASLSYYTKAHALRHGGGIVTGSNAVYIIKREVKEMPAVPETAEQEVNSH